jgi:hypothetical protein
MKNRPHLIPSLIVALMLLGALADWPYGYYQLLRIATCGVAVYIAFMAYSWQKIWATWLFGFIALLFNPFIPVHLSRELWQPIDVICALLFLAFAFALKDSTKKEC